ncbi:MAG: hypothetical protein GX577_03230, partial [Leptolinea sp.]|nr:hypothetical protein [Leptolinea sp.]
MFPIYDAETAKKTILKRTPLDDMPVPQQILDRLKVTFGKEITPSDAVRQIIQEIRQQGNDAVRRWTKSLDSVDLPDNRITTFECQKA